MASGGGGDFNEIMFEHEKRGGSAKPQSRMSRFRDLLMIVIFRIVSARETNSHGVTKEKTILFLSD